MKSTVRCRKCDERVWQKDRALHTMKHFICCSSNKRESWRDYQKAEKRLFGSVRGWRGEPSKEWLGDAMYDRFVVMKE